RGCGRRCTPPASDRAHRLRARRVLFQRGMAAYRPKGAVAEAARLRFSERAPSPALAVAVARLWSVEAEAGATVRTLPDGCVDVTVDLGARRAWLTGPREASFTFTHARATRLFGVQLQPGHARAVLGVDVGA